MPSSLPSLHTVMPTPCLNIFGRGSSGEFDSLWLLVATAQVDSRREAKPQVQWKGRGGGVPGLFSLCQCNPIHPIVPV